MNSRLKAQTSCSTGNAISIKVIEPPLVHLKSNNWFIQWYEEWAPFSEGRILITLKGYPSSRLLHNIGWDLCEIVFQFNCFLCVILLPSLWHRCQFQGHSHPTPNKPPACSPRKPNLRKTSMKLKSLEVLCHDVVYFLLLEACKPILS